MQTSRCVHRVSQLAILKLFQ